MAMDVAQMQLIIVCVIFGTLAAILYSLRILVLLERRIARMDQNLLRITRQVLKEEEFIEKLVKKRK